MALLGERARSRAAWTALALAGLAGCAILERVWGPRELVFSHRLHVQEQEIDCFSCHEHAGVSDDPGMPAAGACDLCHADLDLEKEPERHAARLFEGEDFRAAHASRLPQEAIFSHARHVAAVEDCGVCHHGIADNERIDGRIGVDMDGCVACHESYGRREGCAACHAEIDESWTPASHDANWLRSHGRRCRRGDTGEAADRCSLCHAEATCAECHRLMPPDDHTNFWRRRGHGITARMDRARCSACHESDSCERCHAETVPSNHRGMWGGTKSLHCLTCHMPLAEEGCSACHASAPSHALAPPKPDWHDPAMNCRQCHGAGQSLSHVDDGGDCNVCHL
jgi:hypothetical protein